MFVAEGEAATLVDLDGAALCERGADINVETRSGKLLRLAFQNATGSMDQVWNTLIDSAIEGWHLPPMPA
jgi:hypothetical protein